MARSYRELEDSINAVLSKKGGTKRTKRKRKMGMSATQEAGAKKRGSSGKGARGNPRFILADCDSETGASNAI